MSLVHTIAPVAATFQSGTESFLGRSRKAASHLIFRMTGLLRAISNRRALASIAAMDHAQLRDIGLTAADVYRARSMPLGDDPTEMLAREVEERRRHRRPAAPSRNG
ncbi:DUF1127 domain-containing protein [Bosea caraganae]|uniref:DUF1127 domain-containing protein n=1 Tax=Bosea caraganae TaxID=2763117 RepID=UPI0011C02574